MAIIVSQKQFETVPAGPYIGTLADIVDLGVVQTSFGPKPKLRFVWRLDKNDKNGRPYEVIRQVNNTVTVKPKPSDLYKTLREIMLAEPPVTMDIETLIGRVNQIFVVINEDKGKTYSNVAGITAPPPGAVAPSIADYVRKKDRQQGQVGQQIQNQTSTPAAPAEEDINF